MSFSGQGNSLGRLVSRSVIVHGVESVGDNVFFQPCSKNPNTCGHLGDDCESMGRLCRHPGFDRKKIVLCGNAGLVNE